MQIYPEITNPDIVRLQKQIDLIVHHLRISETDRTIELWLDIENIKAGKEAIFVRL